ncbi:Calx-beta domain-containing protein [Zeaxanthinibacter sp. PT1]|uniref:Calx-beta domain-containing protein n=1 Tax=Zeaxanthinibacter TaxID=561554 RepID=UPI00234B4074|nr:Calx-beta domain-containing protein [Zeaxanthinibacter sp. PT1]MDC6351866.1 Calx-beta domain-containing protein [Zeaxanthinibacter sp. PT1]
MTFLFVTAIGLSQETFLDRFDNESYNNNNGTRNFSGAWIEVGDDNDEEEGRIYINNNRLYFENLDNATIQRSLDLSGAISATLTLDYVTTNGDERIEVQLWDGSNFQKVGELDGSGSFTYTLDPDELLADAAIRFISDSGGWGDSETMYLDNVMVTADYNANIKIDQVTANEDIGTVTFTATYTGAGFVLPFSVNYQTTDGTALATQDYTAVSGTWFFNGVSGQTQTVTVPIIDDEFYEFDEDFFIEMTSSTNATITITDRGKGTITDNEVILGNTPLVLEEQFDGYMDYATTGGTLRTQDNNTDACAFTTSSSNTLSSPIPGGAVIERALLYWSNSSRVMDPQVTFEGRTVDATTVYTTSIAGMDFFSHTADVTDLILGIPNPSANVYDFSGLSIDNTGSYCSLQATLGGWSLMIFYTAPGLPASTINLYEGFDGTRYNTTSFTLSGFYAIGSTGAKTTILSWEGDQTLGVDEFLRFNTPLTGTNTLAGDGDNDGVGTNNPFNSTHFDNTITPALNNTNNHGVDLDTYDVSPFIQAGESTATTQVRTGQDFVAMNAVVLKVPSNLIIGRVFEDMNYGGGAGRDMASSGGIPLEGARVELYDSAGNLFAWENTDALGYYDFAGMANGDYTVRVVNNTVRSSRPGGAGCNECIPVQTYKANFENSALIPVSNKVGGNFPAATDVGDNTLTGAQSTATVTIFNEGAVGLDFGFNFNTIVNSNEDGQGSLEQFIVNSEKLGETGLDIVANAIFDPAAGEDTSIFMIPPTGDALGRAADTRYASGFFDILITDGAQLSAIKGNNTIIDGRTQTAYSGDTNPGSLGASGTAVGTDGAILPTFERPEIQVRGQTKEVFRPDAVNISIRNLAITANDKAAVVTNNGSVSLISNIIGADASGNPGALEFGVEHTKGSLIATGNYFTNASETAVLIDQADATLLEYNHLDRNGTADGCADNIFIKDGTNVQIFYNLIEGAGGTGIDADKFDGPLVIEENTIKGNGTFLIFCGGGVYEDAGIRIAESDARINHNVIHSNFGEGVVVVDKDATGILISQNAMFNNGQRSPSLGIDLDRGENHGDGVSLNDIGDGDDGPNGRLNFPIFESVSTVGQELVIRGWARPGSVIELFVADISLGSATMGDNQLLGLTQDYGEGQSYIGTVTEGSPADQDATISLYTGPDGNTDSTNYFTFRIPISGGARAGYYLTATATIGNNTSEFSPVILVKPGTTITNRRITYRVNN